MAEGGPVVHSRFMRVSVVVPCHNSLDWLPSTLESVLAQSFVDFEVVLVDDGGDDDLLGWASALDDGRVRAVRQENGGVASARNRGIAEARGELIALLDSDDLWEPWTLDSLVEAHDRAVASTGPGERPIGLTYGWYDVIDEHGATNGRAVTSNLEGDIWDELVVANVVAVGSALVPSSVFAEIGGPLENRDRFDVDVEDWEFWIRVAASYRVALVPRVVLHVRRHGSNSTGAGATESLGAAYAALLERVFDPARTPPRDPRTLAELRARAATRSDVLLAWHSMNLDGDTSAAAGHLRSARSRGSDWWRDPEYVRARLALAARQLLGTGGYEAVRCSSHVVRRPLARLRTRRG